MIARKHQQQLNRHLSLPLPECFHHGSFFASMQITNVLLWALGVTYVNYVTSAELKCKCTEGQTGMGVGSDPTQCVDGALTCADGNLCFISSMMHTHQHDGYYKTGLLVLVLVLVLIVIIIMVRPTQVVFILYAVFLPALCCDWLRRYMDLSDRCLSLVQDLGGPMTEEDSPLPFPRTLYRLAAKSQAPCKLAFVRDSLGHILDLYQQVNMSAVSWDATKTENLLVLLHRQKEEVSYCSSPENCLLTKPLKVYYHTLTTATLNHTEGSSASWELIRSESQLHLQQLHLLVANM
nr:uncharacterized protein LOC133620240 isoform X2 [Nerophis lumbriciformis]